MGIEVDTKEEKTQRKMAGGRQRMTSQWTDRMRYRDMRRNLVLGESKPF